MNEKESRHIIFNNHRIDRLFCIRSPFFKKTDPLGDMFIVHPANRVITNEVILNGDEADKGNLEDIDWNDEEQIRELARKQYKQGESGEIIFVKEPDYNLE